MEATGVVSMTEAELRERDAMRDREMARGKVLLCGATHTHAEDWHDGWPCRLGRACHKRWGVGPRFCEQCNAGWPTQELADLCAATDVEKGASQ